MPRKKKPETPPTPPPPTPLETYLALVADDQTEVPTLPDTTGMGPLAAAKAIAGYHRALAEKYDTDGQQRRIRTRGMIILGALAAEHASPTLQATLRELVREHATPRDLATLQDVVPWLKPTAPGTTNDP